MRILIEMANGVNNLNAVRNAKPVKIAPSRFPYLIVGVLLIAGAFLIFAWVSEAFSGKPFKMAPQSTVTGAALRNAAIKLVVAYGLLFIGLIMCIISLF
jgi:hypothetical protein